MKIGYARVSTIEQNLDMQIEALKRAGCEKIFMDKISGLVDERPGLIEAVHAAKPGDTVVVWKLDRIARTVEKICNVKSGFDTMNINLQSLTEQIDTSNPVGKMVFHVLASFAEFERDISAERRTEGIAAAKARGVKFGRGDSYAPERIEEAIQLRKAGVRVGEIAKRTGMDVTRVSRLTKGFGVPRLWGGQK